MVFCLWTVAESVAVDIGVQVLALLLKFSWMYTQEWSYWGQSGFTVGGILSTVSTAAAPFCIPTVCKCSYFSTSLPTLTVFCFNL